MVSVSVLKAERVVVLGFPDALRNQRSEVLKNFKKLSENGRAVGTCPMSDRLRSFAVDCVAGFIWSPYPADPMAAHRKSDRRRDDFCVAGLHKRA